MSPPRDNHGIGRSVEESGSALCNCDILQVSEKISVRHTFEGSERTLHIDKDGAWTIASGNSKITLFVGSGQLILHPQNGQVIVREGNGQIIIGRNDGQVILSAGRGQIILDGQKIYDGHEDTTDSR